MRKSNKLKRLIIFMGGICLCILTICLVIAMRMESTSYTEESATVEDDFNVGSAIEGQTGLEKEQECVDIWGEGYITEIKFGYGEYATQNDIMHIGQLCHLKSLIISIDDETIDLAPLGNLSELELLSISIMPGNALDLSFMEELKQLKELRITAGEEVDLSPIGSLTSLKQLSLESHYVSDLSFLKKLNQLEDIYMDRVCTMEDLSYFQDMAHLKRLYISYVDDVDLEYLSKLENLEDIEIIGENIRNPEGLSNMAHLRDLNLDNIYPGETIFDCSSLAQLPKLESITLTDILVEDVSPLAEADNLSYIRLAGTGVEDISPLKDLELDYLGIYGNENESVRKQAEEYFSDIYDLTVTEEMPH